MAECSKKITPLPTLGFTLLCWGILELRTERRAKRNLLPTEHWSRHLVGLVLPFGDVKFAGGRPFDPRLGGQHRMTRGEHEAQEVVAAVVVQRGVDVRHALPRPLPEGGDERVLRQLLGKTDIAHQPRDAGDQFCRLDPPDRLDGAARIARRHEPFGCPTWACISGSPAAASRTSSGKSDISCTWRISMISLAEAGQRDAHSIASSRDFTWIIQ